MEKMEWISNKSYELCKTFWLVSFFCQTLLVFIGIPIECGKFFDQPSIISEFDELFALYTGKVFIGLSTMAFVVVICYVLLNILIGIICFLAKIIEVAFAKNSEYQKEE